MVMQRPQFGLPSMVRRSPLRDLHRSYRTNSFIGSLLDQVFPVTAPEGQCFTQSSHSPHCDSVTGASALRGASVRTLAQESFDPYHLLMINPFLPIHPSPEQVAAALWLNSR